MAGKTMTEGGGLKDMEPPGYLSARKFRCDMAGHSQFKNIMFRKGKQDKERSKLFSKLGREITVASKAGLPDPKLNARLRGAIIEARAQNMTKDAI
jgi:hypothetical protein